MSVSEVFGGFFLKVAVFPLENSLKKKGFYPDFPHTEEESVLFLFRTARFI